MPDGSDYSGKKLLSLVRRGQSPFEGRWDVGFLIREIEENLKAEVVDVPFTYKGSNNYGFHIKLSDGRDIMARLARGDVNMPDYDGFSIGVQVPEVMFEVATYKLLDSQRDIRVSRLLHHRLPIRYPGHRLQIPQDIYGRRLMVFEKAEGENNVWNRLCTNSKNLLLAQAALIRASLFKFNVPLEFASQWFLARLFDQKPRTLAMPVAPTREFCLSLFASKLEATIKGVGDIIGWKYDNHEVGPLAAAAKQSLLRLVPYIVPAETDQTRLYRFVLDHGDFGIHNMSIASDPNGQPTITSLYDWEAGCIVPAILSDPLMAVTVDLTVNGNGAPSIARTIEEDGPAELAEYLKWSRGYFQVLFAEAPEYERAIRAGKDARHLWFALRDWRGEDPERYFGELGTWAENRLKELDEK